MAVKDLRTSPMMRHLLDAVNAATDIGEYGRLTVVMVARHYLEPDELVKLLTKGGSTDEQAARALVQQVEAHGYNPPTRERILEWQAQQAFPICPTPENLDACNIYKELDLPEEVFRHIEAYREQQVAADDTAR